MSLIHENCSFEGQMTTLEIHKTKIVVERSDLSAHSFKRINILGTDYFKKAHLVLNVDYPDLTVKLMNKLNK